MRNTKVVHACNRTVNVKGQGDMSGPDFFGSISFVKIIRVVGISAQLSSYDGKSGAKGEDRCFPILRHQA